MKIYPLMFQKIFIPKVWGANEIDKYKYSSEEKIGEVWLLSDGNPKSIIRNGDLAGKDFAYLMDHFSKKILGEDKLTFPLQVKYIISTDKLSVQVHPNSKSEIIYSLKPCIIKTMDVEKAKENALTLIKEIENDESKICDVLCDTMLDENSFAYIRPGLVHSFDGGFEGIEISDSSNVTYRIYDYGRNRIDCKNTLSQALEAIDLESEFKVSDKSIYGSRFNVTEKMIEGREIIEEDEYMHIFILIDGKMRIETNDDTFNNELYEVMLIPSDLTGYEIIGYGKYIDIMLNRIF